MVSFISKNLSRKQSCFFESRNAAFLERGVLFASLCVVSRVSRLNFARLLRLFSDFQSPSVKGCNLKVETQFRPELILKSSGIRKEDVFAPTVSTRC